jgi:hypothetical protein
VASEMAKIMLTLLMDSPLRQKSTHVDVGMSDHWLINQGASPWHKEPGLISALGKF